MSIEMESTNFIFQGRNIHVIWDGNSWVLEREYGATMHGEFANIDIALDEAIRQARPEQVDVVVHNKLGKILYRISITED